MSQQLTAELDFLQRALGSGEGGDPRTVGLFPATLPADFPLTLPPLPGLRVLGSVRSMAPRWSFDGVLSPEQWQWRVFLDVGAGVGETMQAFQAALRAAGWEAARAFSQVFVGAEQSQWGAVHAAHSRQLGLQLRQAGAVTQVWLSLSDVEAASVGHLLGGHHVDHYEAPLPTLFLPPGWRGRLQQGSGGPVHSQEYQLFGPAELDLLAHFLPQLDAQGWRLLHLEEELCLFRTALGSGTLILRQEEGALSAHIVHVTAEKGSGSRMRTSARF